jgi:hypothetical protein
MFNKLKVIDFGNYMLSGDMYEKDPKYDLKKWKLLEVKSGDHKMSPLEYSKDVKVVVLNQKKPY